MANADVYVAVAVANAKSEEEVVVVVVTSTSSRGDARLSIFVAHHLAPLARTYSAHRPSRNREIQR